jgi:hypothetical protein
MEILAILLGIAGAIFAILKIVHSHKDKIAKIERQVKTSKAELFQLSANILDLLEKLDSKFTDKYLASLEEALIEDEFLRLQGMLNLARANKQFIDFERKMFFEKLDNELDKKIDFLIQIEKLIDGKKAAIQMANRLLSSRAIEGLYLPMDESLSENKK